jgi:hypothetical protein
LIKINISKLPEIIVILGIRRLDSLGVFELMLSHRTLHQLRGQRSCCVGLVKWGSIYQESSVHCQLNSTEKEKLSNDGSSKVVNHVAISLAGGGEDIHYDVGEALEVWSLNCPQQVAGILNAGGFSGREIVV